MDFGIAIAAAFLMIAGLTALLYYMGSLTLNNKSAKLFLMNGTYDYSFRHIKIKSCKGTIKQVLRFKDCEARTLKLDSELVYGSVVINIKDFSGKVNVSVGEGFGDTAEFTPELKKAYYITITFKNADGELWFTMKKTSDILCEAAEENESEYSGELK